MKIIELLKLRKKRLIGIKEGDYTNYIKYQKFQAKEILKELKNKNINLSRMKVLELGAGSGGYSLMFKKYVKELIVSDLVKHSAINSSLNFKEVDLTKKYPFEDNCFDLIISISVIEHVKNPENMMSEIRRVLKPGGYLYLSFPPFYTPTSGHAVKPFQILGENLSIKITNFLKKRDIKDYDTLYGNWGFYKRTIGNVKKLIIKHKLEIEDIWARFTINTTKIPLLNEFMTGNVCFLCKKSQMNEQKKQ